MTTAALKTLSHRIARETFNGRPRASTDKALAHLFEQHWNAFDERRNPTRMLRLWFTRDQYIELRRQLILSGERSLIKFLVKRLGLGAPLNRRELAALRGRKAN